MASPSTAKEVSLDQFLRLYHRKEDSYKYEWNHGQVEKTLRSIDQLPSIIFMILQRYFVQTKAFQQGGGLTVETDMMTSDRQLRRPDIAFYTAEQVARMRKGEKVVSPWVCEVISAHDNINRVNDKLEEYFSAGVQVVWHIFPHSQMVYVYTSLNDVAICRGDQPCSATPALPDLDVRAQALFQ